MKYIFIYILNHYLLTVAVYGIVDYSRAYTYGLLARSRYLRHTSPKRGSVSKSGHRGTVAYSSMHMQGVEGSASDSL